MTRLIYMTDHLAFAISTNALARGKYRSVRCDFAALHGIFMVNAARGSDIIRFMWI